jgi:cytochrome c553
MKTLFRLVTISILITPLLHADGLGKCTGCHGSTFEKVALGKSKIVKNMTKNEIVFTLKGYRDGTYGGVMKGLMKKAVASLSDNEITQMAEEIKK